MVTPVRSDKKTSSTRQPSAAASLSASVVEGTNTPFSTVLDRLAADADRLGERGLGQVALGAQLAKVVLELVSQA